MELISLTRLSLILCLMKMCQSDLSLLAEFVLELPRPSNSHSCAWLVSILSLLSYEILPFHYLHNPIKICPMPLSS